jgi:hypothetical protein
VLLALPKFDAMRGDLIELTNGGLIELAFEAAWGDCDYHRYGYLPADLDKEAVRARYDRQEAADEMRSLAIVELSERQIAGLAQLFVADAKQALVESAIGSSPDIVAVVLPLRHSHF